MWGWTGRNTPTSLAALRAPTVSDRDHELRILERMAVRVGNDGLYGQPDETMMKQGLRELASAKLADYKEMADADMYQGFEAFLSGELGSNIESSFVPVPYVDASTKHLWERPAESKEILENVQTRCIPWANNHLLHIPGAHGYLQGEYRKKKAFDIYIASLYAMGPQTMDQAWHYYKFIVKQQRPTDRDIEEVVDEGQDPHGTGRRSDWNKELTLYHTPVMGGGGPDGGGGYGGYGGYDGDYGDYGDYGGYVGGGNDSSGSEGGPPASSIPPASAYSADESADESESDYGGDETAGDQKKKIHLKLKQWKKLTQCK
jgi:hypothetical protein